MCSWLPQDKGGNFQLSGGSHRYYDCHAVGSWSDKPLQASGNFCRGRFGPRTLLVHMHTILVHMRTILGVYKVDTTMFQSICTFSAHTLFLYHIINA